MIFFQDIQFFCKPAIKFSKVGRHSGGVVCLVKKEFTPFIKQIDVQIGNFLLFKINKQLFGFDKDLLYVCTYVPPEGSRFYSFYDTDQDGIELLENTLIDCALSKDDFYVILSGDLNGRTSNVHHSVENVDESGISSKSTSFRTKRQSCDLNFNNFGKSLLNMCTSLGLCIMNGLCHGDHEGHYTYICDAGSSVIDYFLMSNELLAILFDDCTLTVLERTESSHMPVSLHVNLSSIQNIVNSTFDRVYMAEKFIWNNDYKDEFLSGFAADYAQSLLNDAMDMIDSDINQSLNMFNSFIQELGSCMKKKVNINGRHRNLNWFDLECKQAKKQLRKSLRKYKSKLTNEDRLEYCKLRREYKHLTNRKKKAYNKTMLDKLLDTINNQSEFWKSMRKIRPKKEIIKNNIALNDWYNHFKSLLDEDPRENDSDDFDGSSLDGNEEDYNRPISYEEILFAIRKLKCSKAAGPDGIIPELLKYPCEFIAPYFLKLFNVLFEKGTYPKNWTESIILPLFKKGDVNVPGNYRGISLCDASSKLFSTIINRRLQTYVEENNLTGEHQAGFKKGYSTSDHMFTLLACIQKQFSSNRKLYVAFIDFRKAFDNVNRNLLWKILLDNGIKGKLFACIKSMYSQVKARIRCGSELTEPINCTAGVKQGDVCSPILFSLFINELAKVVIQNGRHGVNLGNDFLELCILLLADDVVLLSETVVGLQCQLNNLQEAAEYLRLTINAEKSDIMVFRKGGYLSSRERWFLNGSPLNVVNGYKYLGIVFSTKVSFDIACKDLGSRGKKAFLSVIRSLYQYKNNSLDLFLKLFDAQIQPVLQYGSELWGLDKAAHQCEKVHLFALKKFLNVEKRTPNDLVYGELNRYPILINSAMNCIRYWLRIVQMPDDRIPKQAYLMLCKFDAKGSKTWATNVRSFLYENGFGIAWYNQGVGSVNLFLKEIKQRLIDSRWQNWNDHINNSSRFTFYKGFSSLHYVPIYLQMDLNRQIRSLMTRLRFGISSIATHYSKYRNATDQQLICPLCKCWEENELHFVFKCPFFDELRTEYIPHKYVLNGSINSLNVLLSSKNKETTRNLCIYVYKAFKIREIALS